MEKSLQGDIVEDVVSKLEGEGDANGTPEQVTIVDSGVEPPPPEFIMDLPNISSIDL
jgi:splicing factor 3A subunit 1